MSIPDSVQRTLDDMAETFDRKNADYATDSRPWTNFEESAAQVNQTPSQVVETLIAVKQSRLKQLFGTEKSPRNESVRDSLLDRAVYSVIALAMYDEGESAIPTNGWEGLADFEPVEDEWSDFSKRETVELANERYADGGVDWAWQDAQNCRAAVESAAEYFPENVIWDKNVPTGSAFVFDGLVHEPVEGVWNVFEETSEYALDGTGRSSLLRWQVAPDGQIWNDNGKAYGDGLDTFENSRHFRFIGAYDEPQWTVEHEDFPGFLESLKWNSGGKEFARKLLNEGKTVEVSNNGYRYVFDRPDMTAEAIRPDGSYSGFGFDLATLSNDNNKITKVYHS